MAPCNVFTGDMLVAPMHVSITDRALDYTGARRIADERAGALRNDPMLLAWWDGKENEFSPKVECCSDKKPGWLIYAESRGGDIVIDINNEEYVFIYR
ncbi:MAG: AF1514 family protein [Syntrophobacteraceae bacterium]